MASGAEKKPVQHHYQVKRKDLPVACPHDARTLWSQHPRVVMNFDGSGHARCPYCGDEYILID